jgi:hypothetical protein
MHVVLKIGWLPFIAMKLFCLFNIPFVYIKQPPVDSVYEVIKSLPKNFVRDGSVDYTSELQAAISSHQSLLFPPFPLLVNDAGLLIGSNKILNFLPGSEIRLQRSDKKRYNIIKMEGVENITINGLVIKGDRYTHLGTTGEWGMGIGIYSCSNITLNNVKIADCWGDGIYLGNAGGNGLPNSNIVIKQPEISNCRRDGISIITARRLTIISPHVNRTNGVLPMSGINFEPNSPVDELQQISVIEAFTEDNPGSGISIGLKNLYGMSSKKIDISIIGHKDKGSGIALKIHNYLSRRKLDETITGNITITKPIWTKNSNCAMRAVLFDPNLKLLISMPKVTDVQGNSLARNAIFDRLTTAPNVNKEAQISVQF